VRARHKITKISPNFADRVGVWEPDSTRIVSKAEHQQNFLRRAATLTTQEIDEMGDKEERVDDETAGDFRDHIE
jgi:hypothetical protein